MPTTVVFLAAGLSTRYGRPKQIEPVGPGGQSLLDYGIFDALASGADRLVIVTRSHLRPAIEDHLNSTFGPLPLEYATQKTEAGGPAGTGHAVLAAADALAGPFAVANADDFYGRGAWTTLLNYLGDVAPEGPFAMVGYPLEDTLSTAGGVSRAICRLAGGDCVEDISEWRDIRLVGSEVAGSDLSGVRARLDRRAWVSMNLWGFTPALLGALRSRFDHFERAGAGRPGNEFLLSEAVNDQMRSGVASVKLLPSRDRWFGLTHPADRSTVKARLAALTTDGTYPARFDLHLPK